MEHGNDEPSRPEGTGAFSSREDGPSECGPGTVRAVRDWIKKRLDLIRLCLEQAGESVRDLHGVALWLLVLILTVTGSVILVFSPFGSDSATRQPMVSSATRSWFRAAGRFWMISRMSSMASTKFLIPCAVVCVRWPCLCSQPILVDLQSAYDARCRQCLHGIGPVVGRRLAHPCLREGGVFPSLPNRRYPDRMSLAW